MHCVVLPAQLRRKFFPYQKILTHHSKPDCSKGYKDCKKPPVQQGMKYCRGE